LTETSSSAWKTGHDRSRTLLTVANINTAICRRAISEQEDSPQSLHTTQQFARETGMHHSTVTHAQFIAQADTPSHG